MVVLRCKVAVVGEATVGKSALVQMFHSNGATFPKNYLMTQGVELCVKEVPIEDTNVVVELYIFDVSGQSIYFRLIDQYVQDRAKPTGGPLDPAASSVLENTSVCVVVYDVTDKESFDKCTKWLEVCRKQRKNMMAVLIGNKADLAGRQVVSPAVAESFARAHNMDFFQISAIQRADVEQPFHHIAHAFHRSYEEKLKALAARD